MPNIVVELPEPGSPTELHEPGQTVWYHSGDEQFIIDEGVTDSRPIFDTNGNCWSVPELHELALAALAAVTEVEERRRRTADLQPSKELPL